MTIIYIIFGLIFLLMFLVGFALVTSMFYWIIKDVYYDFMMKYSKKFQEKHKNDGLNAIKVFFSWFGIK